MEIDNGLDRLAARHSTRFRRQPHAPDLLPPADAALAPLRAERVQRADGPPGNGRQDMAAQMRHLTEVFEGRSRLEWLHAACISYLRRDTPHTARARSLFRRMWVEETGFLLENLTARWLISAMQTFYDHGETAGERTAGAVGFFYGNFIKIYETERNASRPPPPDSPDTYWPGMSALPGIGGFKPGDDILANMNTLAYDAALNGEAAGPALIRLMELARDGRTIFNRTDAMRTRTPFRKRAFYALSFGGVERLDGGEDTR